VRSKDESKEDKVARKRAVKAEKQSRRVQKKGLKEAFVTEKKILIKAQVGRQEAGARLRKL